MSRSHHLAFETIKPIKCQIFAIYILYSFKNNFNFALLNIIKLFGGKLMRYHQQLWWQAKCPHDGFTLKVPYFFFIHSYTHYSAKRLSLKSFVLLLCQGGLPAVGKKTMFHCVKALASVWRSACVCPSSAWCVSTCGNSFQLGQGRNCSCSEELPDIFLSAELFLQAGRVTLALVQLWEPWIYIMKPLSNVHLLLLMLNS